jgi:hypothetical protein
VLANASHTVNFQSGSSGSTVPVRTDPTEGAIGEVSAVPGGAYTVTSLDPFTVE